MTAWFNYYLQEKTEFYAFLYGERLTADIDAGVIEHGADTSPQGFDAAALPEAAALQWQLTDYPVIVGYHIYRRPAGGSFPSTPQIVVGLAPTVVDAGLAANQAYEYAICSYDRAGNLHQLSEPVTAVPLESVGKLFLPIICK